MAISPADRARDIALMIFDVDGVLTDGTIYYSDAGSEIKGFNTLDGHGMRMLATSGVQVAIITGRTSKLVEARAKDLGITHVFQGAKDKLPVFDSLRTSLGLTPQQCGYMGDDLPDLPVMTRVGFAAAPPAAAALIKSHAHFIAHACGGAGAVREVCEFVLSAQNNLSAANTQYLA